MSKIRNTKSVKSILELFDSTEEAYSGVDLIERFESQMNKTTVYRILERLEIQGLIHSFTDNAGLRWYAKCSNCGSDNHNDKHPHFQCTDCGKIECLDSEIVIPDVSKHRIDTADLLLTGQCEDCVS